MATWRKILEEKFKETHDTWESIEQITLSNEELDIEFDAGFGIAEGKPFTAWSNKFVYFPVVYDGAEWVECVSRNPDGKPTNHFGGQ